MENNGNSKGKAELIISIAAILIALFTFSYDIIWKKVIYPKYFAKTDIEIFIVQDIKCMLDRGAEGLTIYMTLINNGDKPSNIESIKAYLFDKEGDKLKNVYEQVDYVKPETFKTSNQISLPLHRLVLEPGQQLSTSFDFYNRYTLKEISENDDVWGKIDIEYKKWTSIKRENDYGNFLISGPVYTEIKNISKDRMKAITIADYSLLLIVTEKVGKSYDVLLDFHLSAQELSWLEKEIEAYKTGASFYNRNPIPYISYFTTHVIKDNERIGQLLKKIH